ncbi:MAG TPA: hypothetical protein VH008_14800 [Pseudonocardia sp.]|jgi:hypothetical protein|nr:hypothetical protein [Pseudonocardia sp.]
MITPHRPTWRRAPLLAMTVLIVTTGAACGGPSNPPVGEPPTAAAPPSGATAAGANAAGRPSWAAPPPSGPGQPSASALQVCDPNDGQKDIAAALGVTPTRVETPTWVDHLYSCRYVYPNGSFTLSVKELADDPSTVGYLDELAGKLGQVSPLDGIGEVAFFTRNRSIVARKDNKVLLVDVSGLPPQFGSPPGPPAAMSRTIATVIMGCWSGG